MRRMTLITVGLVGIGIFTIAFVFTYFYQINESSEIIEADVESVVTSKTVDKSIEIPGFVLTYSDEFDGENLDETIWYPGLPEDWDTTSLNDEDQSYTKENIVLRDGLLSLIMEKREVVGRKNGRKKTYQYASGCINTHERVAQKYGVWEIRAKLPSALGSWPAFWLMPENGNIYTPVGAEIDIFENLALWGEDIQFGVHYNGYGDDHQHTASPMVKVNNISSEFHVYTLKWHPDYLQLYVDGIQVAEYVGEAVPMTDHYAIINAAMGGWGGDIDDHALEDSMALDYFRVYQFEDMKAIEEAELSKLESMKKESTGLDFEHHDLQGVISYAGQSFEDDFVHISAVSREIVSGKKSYIADTTDQEDGDYNVYVSPLGTMTAYETYTISFDYKVLEKSKDDLFYYYIGSASDPNVKSNIIEFDPGAGANEGSGVIGSRQTNMNTSAIEDAVLVIGVRNQARISLDNINISKYMPPSRGIDFETISLNELKDSMVTSMDNIYFDETVVLTQDPSEVISGQSSLKCDAYDLINQWNEFYHTPIGLFKANTSYEVTFNYKVLNKAGNAFFYTLGRSMSKADGAPDLLGWTEWYDEMGGQGEITINLDIPDYEDYYLIIGIHRNGTMVVDNIVIEEQ